MIKYETTTGNEFEFSLEDETYVLASKDEFSSQGRGFFWDGRYRGKAATKGLLTRNLTDIIRLANRKSAQTGPALIDPRHRHRLSNIYKHDKGEWTCIFSPDSPAVDAFFAGKINAKELRDMIPW